MSIEGQIREIATEELKRQLDEIEKRFMEHLENEIGELDKRFMEHLEKELGELEKRFMELIDKELEEVKNQLSDISTRTENLEKELSDRWNVMVKLRKYTLDQMVSEYRRIMDLIRPGKEEIEETLETPENAEI